MGRMNCALVCVIASNKKNPLNGFFGKPLLRGFFFLYKKLTLRRSHARTTPLISAHGSRCSRTTSGRSSQPLAMRKRQPITCTGCSLRPEGNRPVCFSACGPCSVRISKRNRYVVQSYDDREKHKRFSGPLWKSRQVGPLILINVRNVPKGPCRK